MGAGLARAIAPTNPTASNVLVTNMVVPILFVAVKSNTPLFPAMEHRQLLTADRELIGELLGGFSVSRPSFPTLMGQSEAKNKAARTEEKAV